MSEISAANATARQSLPGKKTGAMQELGKDAFLKLLVTQLRYQDPLSPQDNSAFVAQMAQFTALEQMQNLNAAMSQLLQVQNEAKSLAPLYLGLLVTMAGKDGPPVTGRVDAVEYDNGRPHLVVNGRRYSLGEIQKIAGGEE